MSALWEWAVAELLRGGLVRSHAIGIDAP